MIKHDRVYNSILKEKLGDIYDIIENIKYNQCINCDNKNKCLLIIKEESCINYVKNNL